MSKALALMLLALLVLSSFAIAGSVFAESIPKPSVPEFTLKYVDNSYDVPPSTTTTTDPYTGEQTLITKPGYHVKNGTIEVTIKNQEFMPYSIDSQTTISLFYYVSYKGHYAEDWDYYPPSTYGREYSAIFITQSTSDYTVVQFKAPPEGEMDFRVQAQIGYYTSTTAFVMVPGAPFTTYTFNGEVSGWSNTQTITVGESQTATPSPTTTPKTSPAPTSTPEPTSTPTSSPSQENLLTQEQSVILGLTVTVVVLSAGLGLLLYLIKRK